MLRLRNISFTYPGSDERVVHDVTAAAPPGRITAIIGPNAAGKSTLLRLMAGVLAPDRGEVRLGDMRVVDLSPAARAARLAFVPQRPRVDAPFTVREVVELGRFALRRSDEAVLAAMVRCDLDAHADRLFNALSVGQQQRAALARAVAQVSDRHDAAILLDEPTSALDPRHVQQTARVLRELADSGRTVVIILHDLNLAERMSDDAWIMHEGRIVAAGPTREVFQPATLERVYGVRFTRGGETLVAEGS